MVEERLYTTAVESESSVQEAVWKACQEGDLESVNELLNCRERRRQVDSWVHPNFEQNALHVASLHGHDKVVETLLRTHKINPNTQTKRRRKTALHLSCDECHERVVKVLLENGANPNLAMLNLQTPLHRCIRWGSPHILRALIDKGSNLDDQDEEGNTALHIAAGIGRPTMIKLLVEKGANLSLLNKKRKTACAISIEKGFYVSQHYLDCGSQQMQQNLPPRSCYSGGEQLVTGKCSTSGEVSDAQRNRKRSPILGKYLMKSSPSSHCIIINNFDFTPAGLPRREGSDQDAAALQRVFGGMLGLSCSVKTNLTAEKIKETMATYREMDHSNRSCLVVAILSHGDREGILGVDGASVSVEKITSYFGASECPELGNKPKIFIFQACRGGQRERAIAVATNSEVSIDSVDSPIGGRPTSQCSSEKEEEGVEDYYFKVMPNMADYVLAYSTMPGCVSYRNNKSGSWFIQHLTEALAELASRESFLDILTEVNRRVATEASDELEVQIPSPQFSLRYKLFFQMQ